MARGWESKAVSDQIEEGNQAKPSRSHLAHTPEERQRQLRLESLRLSRSRLLAQLEKANHPAHRDVLLKGLRAIEQQIDAVSSEQPEER